MDHYFFTTRKSYYQWVCKIKRKSDGSMKGIKLELLQRDIHKKKVLTISKPFCQC